MNSTPTPAAVLALIMAAGLGRYDSLYVFAEDGTHHHGAIVKRTDTNDAADVVVEFKLPADGTERKTGTFLIAVRRLDLESPAERAVADVGGLDPEVTP